MRANGAKEASGNFSAPRRKFPQKRLAMLCENAMICLAFMGSLRLFETGTK